MRTVHANDDTTTYSFSASHTLFVRLKITVANFSLLFKPFTHPMGTAIEWSEETWNPTTGCTKVSDGCKNCYAETLSKRLAAWGKKKYRNVFKFTEHPDDVDLPLHWKKPRKIFVNSMSDLFHEDARIEFIGQCFDVMMRAHHHTYQILTKRPKKMAEFSAMFTNFAGFNIPNHIWMGTSIEDSRVASRIDDLRKVECGVRFISFEPLIGPVGNVDLSGIDWAIIGGESGKGFRPVKEEWIQDLIRQCEAQGVAVFFKQWGGHRPKSGGRTINGRTYDAYPEIKPSPSDGKITSYLENRK